ncbi:MAG: UbiX family flavin prenyltransferase [Candidatus Methanofastidiosia archaeon]|jgi:4-hydroxy-3-polyprenylbenzoate decarboxylase
MKIVIGITGASGAIYGIRLLQILKEETFLVVSQQGKKVMAHETGYTHEDLHYDHYYHDDQLDAPLSSGSFLFDAMVVVPCSLSTVSKIATGIADTLITRCASVALKEGRTLIVVPRETPLNTVQLKNMMQLSLQGAAVLPAMPGFYHGPESVQDMVDFMVGKILDQLHIGHDLYNRWNPHPDPGPESDPDTE